MINSTAADVTGAGAATLEPHESRTGWAEAGFSLAGARPGDDRRAGLPSPLSTEARLLADALGLPISAPDDGGRGSRPALRQYVRALNDLIVGPGEGSPTLELLRGRIPDAELAELMAGELRLALAPLWGAGELDRVERLPLEELEAEWRRRVAARIPGAAGVVRDDLSYAAIWKEMPGGDFDVGGRGVDYTDGMRAFPACRALGVQSLLTLLGAFDPGPRVYLDVLGGEGYVWRLLEAKRQLAQRQVVAVPAAAFGAGGAVSADLEDLLARTARADPGALIMAVDAPADGGPCTGRLVGLAAGRVMVSRPMPLSAQDIVRWLCGGPAPQAPGANGDGGPAGGALASMIRERNEGATPVMITNDVSQHMFYRAGVWGMPTREDALRMSRTFRADSLDGVLCAYGTHHIPDIYAAVRESRAILKPGGRLVVHDFFDRGPVGSWFHDVVDRYSTTGHDFPHIGPVEMAVHLFRAGFRDVELMEIDDPFIFTAEAGDALGAREIALRYTMGMYGMTHHFAGRLDELEALVHQVLAYPELGESAVFEQDFAFIPRRAVVACGRKPEPAEDPAFSASDAALIRTLGSALRAERGAIESRTVPVPRGWFGEDGERWGLSLETQRDWLEWERAQRAAGALA